MTLLFRQVLPAALLLLGLHGTADAAKSAAKSSSKPVAAATKETCNWNRPGVDPFTGDVVAAVDRYTDIPSEVRGRLKARMAKREYDDMVTIRRDAIAGRKGYEYAPAIRDMHFGAGKVCRTVNRKAWSSKTVERGLVYCDSGQCILVPTVCRNVSRIARRGVSDGSAGGGDSSAGSGGAGGAGAGGDGGGGTAGAFSTGSRGESPGGAIESLPPTGAGPTSTASSVGGGGGSDAPVASTLGPGVSGASAIPGVIYGPSAGNGGGILVVDDPAVVTPIPEPHTWALMLGGLAVIAGFARRRASKG
jgi:PEP-CTERM motif